MTIPAPPKRHRLEACTSRFLFQLQRTKAYLDAVMPALAAQGETTKPAVLLPDHRSHAPHLRRGALPLAGVARHPLASRGREALLGRAEKGLRAHIEEMPFASLMKLAQQEVGFRKKGKNLKSLFALLFNAGPFADADAEAKCLDLIYVRNLITHQGGLIEDEYLQQFSSPDVLVRRETSGDLVFHHLEIQPAFFAATLAALGRSVTAIDESLKQDPRYSI